MKEEETILAFGLIIGVLLWYGMSRVRLPDHAGRAARDHSHQPKGKP